MNEPAPGVATKPVTKTWAYGGIRADKDGKKWHAWERLAVFEEHVRDLAPISGMVAAAPQGSSA